MAINGVLAFTDTNDYEYLHLDGMEAYKNDVFVARGKKSSIFCSIVLFLCTFICIVSDYF